jgi:hypothetical protein
MPIVLPPDQNDPIAQGDILKGLTLYTTDADWAAGKANVVQKSIACLIMSRPCVTAHKTELIVASVERYKYDRPDAQSFQDIQDFLVSIRDGVGTPDRFYLGQIPDLGDGMYSAHFDSLHTIRIPTGDQLIQSLQKHRIGRLAPDFARDLHLRFFSAFASLGFDDVAWYADKDLEWLVQAGEKELAAERQEFAAAAASGTFRNAQHRESLNKKISERATALEPLKHELSKRKMPPNK